jgi:hypothetical protein
MSAIRLPARKGLPMGCRAPAKNLEYLNSLLSFLDH